MFCFADCLLIRCSRHGFKGSSCFQDADLRVWKTSFLGHESSFSFICRGGGYFTGQPVFNASASGKDRLGQCLRLGWPTAGGRPLHPQAIKRRLVGQDFAQLSGAPRFQSPFFHPGGCECVDRKYGPALDDDILLGNLKPAYEIYDLYQKRVDERVAKVKEFLKQPVDFKTDGTIDFRPEKSAVAEKRGRGRRALARPNRERAFAGTFERASDRARAQAGRAPLRSAGA